MRGEAIPTRVVIVTLDRHLGAVAEAVEARLERASSGLTLSLHAASEWEADPAALDSCRADIARAHIVIVSMIFLEDQVRAIRPALEARREACDAMAVIMSAPELVKLTRLGGFRMDAPDSGAIAALKKLRGKPSGAGQSSAGGAAQMAMLRRLPKLLRLIPGKAQDVRAYFLTMQYWLSGSLANVENMARFLVNRYADGDRKALRGALPAALPVEYPETGLYHPRLPGKITTDLAALPPLDGPELGRVGVLIMRSYVLADDAAHYDGVIAALEAKGLRAIPAFASGLDARPAIEAFFTQDGAPTIDALLSLTGFSLVGGPAYNDSRAAEELLAGLDIPYVAAHALEFQTLDAWRTGNGLTPVEATIMVALPELDGAIAPTVYGGRGEQGCGNCTEACRAAGQGTGASRHIRPCQQRAASLAARLGKLVALRRSARAERRLAVVLFNFPPNSGATGTAAYLSVFASLHNTLIGLRNAGYSVEVPASVEALRIALLEGNAAEFGQDGNVHHRIAVDDHVRREPHLRQIEAAWGPAPGKQQSDGRSLFVLGRQFGHVLVSLQPGFGYEGDPMRLLFEGNFAPTHAFSAFYRYLREDFAAHAVLHFGTHGALEFMPGKAVGLSGACWPDRLIGDLPNVYLYAANNPSEGALAKRRAAATLVSYLTPPMAQAGLYKGLLELKASVDRWRAGDLDPELKLLIEEQAAALDLDAGCIETLATRLYEYEQTLIPHGMHVLGRPARPAERVDMLLAMAAAHPAGAPHRDSVEALVAGAGLDAAVGLSGLAPSAETAQLFAQLAIADGHLARDSELPGLIHALDGGYVRPVPGGDLLRTPAILPTGRNLHGFDPFRLPSAFAMRDGAAQAQRLLDRTAADGKPMPETVALVLWGTDNLKTEGGPIGQALALLGAKARFDTYGRLCGAELVPLADLGRPRIDVMMTLSGIFRDLLPLQTKLLAEAAWLAASADEPVEFNFVRKHALAHAAALGCDLETASLRVFSNADGAYGANVNHLIDAGCWTESDELADQYESRKGFAYGRSGKPSKQAALFSAALSTVDVAFQNLDSMELGVTTIDHYVDMLGGLARSAERAKGGAVPVYVGDQTQGTGKVRSLAEQVSLETRTRTLNPRWYNGLLEHGYEGVRQIEAQVTNTMGWSATTSQVAPWVYQRISETFVLDAEMRNRLATLNPKASARMAGRLIEAHERRFWTPDPATLAALRQANDEIEDRLEGVLVAAG